MSKKQTLDGFDRMLADNMNSTHLYEDYDANLQGVLRPWHDLSAESKLGYIARDAALCEAPFERYAQAAREAVGDQPLPAGEDAYLRLHLEYQRALWDPELPAFPSEHPLPADEPHRDFLESIDGILAAKFYRLLNEDATSRQLLPDANGQARMWLELSAEGKIRHVARIAAIFDAPFSRFTEAAREAIGGQTLHTDEQSCLRLCYQYARQAAGLESQSSALTSTGDQHEAVPGEDPWLRGSIDPMLTELEAFGDEFERLAHTRDQRQVATHFKDWIHSTSRTLFTPLANPLAARLFSEAAPRPEAPHAHSHDRQHKR